MIRRYLLRLLSTTCLMPLIGRKKARAFRAADDPCVMVMLMMGPSNDVGASADDDDIVPPPSVGNLPCFVGGIVELGGARSPYIAKDRNA